MSLTIDTIIKFVIVLAVVLAMILLVGPLIQKVVSPIEGILWSTGPAPSNQSTFFMHTDSVCKGECVAEIIPFTKHIVNPDGDNWEDKLYFP